MHAFTEIIIPVAHEFSPDLVIVSAGFDAGQHDPIGGCNITPACFAQMTHLLQGLAHGKVVMLLEGGYHVPTVSACVVSCISALLKKPLASIDTRNGASMDVIQVVEKVKRVLQPHWNSLRPLIGNLGMRYYISYWKLTF